MYDVKKYFGATADGNSDDTLAVLDAVNSGLTPIFFPPGDYAVTPGDIIIPSEHMGLQFRGAGAKCRSSRTAKKSFFSRIIPAQGSTTDATLKELPLIIDLSEGTAWHDLTFRGLEEGIDPDATPERLKRLVLMRGTAGHPNFLSKWTNCSFQFATHYAMKLDTREFYSTIADFTMHHVWFERISNPGFVHDSTDPEKLMADAFVCDNEQAITIYFYGWYGTFVDRCFNINAGGNMAVFGGGLSIGRVLLRLGKVVWTDSTRFAGLNSAVVGISFNDFKLDAQGPRCRLLEDVKISISGGTRQGRTGGLINFNRMQFSSNQSLGDNHDGPLEASGPFTNPVAVDEPIIVNYGGNCVVLNDCIIGDSICLATDSTTRDGTLALLDSGDYDPSDGGRTASLIIQNHHGLKHVDEMGAATPVWTFARRYLQLEDSSLKTQPHNAMPVWAANNLNRHNRGLESEVADGPVSGAEPNPGEGDQGTYIGGDVDVWTKAEKDTQIADMVIIKPLIQAIPDSGAMTSIAQASALTTVDTVVDAIKVVTDVIPDSGAMTSIAQASALTTVDTVVDAIKVVTDAIPENGAMTSIAKTTALILVDQTVDAIKLVTDLIPDLGAMTSIATAANLTTVDTVVDAIQLVTDAIPDAGAMTSIATAAALTTVDTEIGLLQVDVTQLIDLEEGDRVIVVGAGSALELHRFQKTTKALLQTKQLIKKIDGTTETDPDQSPGQLVT